MHARGARPPLEELERLEAADEWPRVTLFEKALRSDMLDESALAAAGGARRLCYRVLPSAAAQALEAFGRRREYDAVISWAEDLGLAFAALKRLTGDRTPHVGLFGWLSSPRKAALLRRLHPQLDRIVVWSRGQYACAVERLGVPATKVVLLRWLVDTTFWRPLPGAGDLICSAGREMRDYATLVEAMRGWEVRCHIAANAGAGRRDRWMSDLAAPGALPPNVTLGPRSFRDLRALYARSRFVVLPILPTDTDNGVTAMLEAMAMGKAVICSRVQGQTDVLVDGVTGLFVPPQDPGALRAAMEHLWAHPEICERMGQEGRRVAERHHAFDAWVEDVRRVVEEAVAEVRGGR